MPGRDDGDMDSETTLLIDCLTQQRSHVIGILDGLSDEDLHRPVLPSGWTCLGLVNHLALDVEQFWFQEVVAGETSDPGAPDGEASAWNVPVGTPPGEVFARYARASERADTVIGRTPLATPPAAWPPFFGSWRLVDLRAVVLHVIAETACHAGHLDAARELIDGRTWLILG